MIISQVHLVGTTFFSEEKVDLLAFDGRKEDFDLSRLTLKAEPDNPHDSNAIGCYFDGEKVGHVNAAAAKSIVDMMARRQLTSLSVTQINVFAANENPGFWIDIEVS